MSEGPRMRSWGGFALILSAGLALVTVVAADDGVTAGPAPAAAIDRFVKGTKAIQDLVAAVVGSVGWAIVALVLLLYFRESLRQLLRALADAVRDRSVSFDVATVVKVQVGERALGGWDDRPALSPLKIEDAPIRDHSSILGEIPTVLVFASSDYVARRWVSRSDAAMRSADAMRTALSTLAQACAANQDFVTLKGTLVDFVRRLEAARFLEAHRLHDLLVAYPMFLDAIKRTEVENLSVGHEDFLLLHCAGVASAQRGDWPKAKALLDKIAWKDQKPHYLPAGDAWLACAHRQFIESSLHKTGELDLDEPESAAPARRLLDQGQQIAEAMAAPNWWSRFPVAGANAAYYKRELFKVIGAIGSVLGACDDREDDRARFFWGAERRLD